MSVFAAPSRHNHGFTIVEIIVVVVVLSILVAITIFYIGDWRGRTAETEVKNNLTNAAAAMENARNFSGTYPATLPSTFTPSEHVAVQLVSSSATGYCINGQSTARSDIRLHITAQASPSSGDCS